MKIIQLTPGTGNFYCGTCIRDNALVNALRKLGHDALIGPMYLPILTDEPADGPASASQPVRFNGVNVYLQQKFNFFRKAPRWVDRIFGAGWMLKLAAKRAGMTQASDLGDITVSMLRGEEGRQSKEIDKLIDWLKQEKPDVVGLSNCLLVGMARKIKQEVGAAVVCTLNGEDAFLDSLPETDSQRAWDTLTERAKDVDAFIAVSGYFGELMKRRMHIPDQKLHMVHNGISLEGYGDARNEDAPDEASPGGGPPTIGYLARMCHGKGLGTLVDAFVALKKRDTIKEVKLSIAGTKTPIDDPFIESLRKKLSAAGCLEDVSFHANVSRDQKIRFLKSLSVFSVPATYGEAFGLYIIEAMAAGVPVVQPKHGAFPELIEATGGGILCEPDDPESLADGLEQLLLNPDQGQQLGAQGRKAVFDRYANQHMAQSVLAVYEKARALRAKPNTAATS